MKTISLYTGAGGLDVGLEAAGFRTCVAVEYDADAAATIRANRAWPLLEHDIHEVRSQEILETARLKEGDTDLLVAGPPCQPFSKSAYWRTGMTRRLDDPRASTLEQFLRVLRDAKPKAFLLENVPGLGYKGKDEGLDLLKEIIEVINREVGTNYAPSEAVLNAAEYGVPQDRRRLFVVAHSDGVNFEFPRETHRLPNPRGPVELEGDGLEPWSSAWDAIGDLAANDDASYNQVRVGGSTWTDSVEEVLDLASQ